MHYIVSIDANLPELDRLDQQMELLARGLPREASFPDKTIAEAFIAKIESQSGVRLIISKGPRERLFDGRPSSLKHLQRAAAKVGAVVEDYRIYEKSVGDFVHRCSVAAPEGTNWVSSGEARIVSDGQHNNNPDYSGLIERMGYGVTR